MDAIPAKSTLQTRPTSDGWALCEFPGDVTEQYSLPLFPPSFLPGLRIPMYRPRQPNPLLHPPHIPPVRPVRPNRHLVSPDQHLVEFRLYNQLALRGFPAVWVLKVDYLLLWLGEVLFVFVFGGWEDGGGDDAAVP